MQYIILIIGLIGLTASTVYWIFHPHSFEFGMAMWIGGHLFLLLLAWIMTRDTRKWR